MNPRTNSVVHSREPVGPAPDRWRNDHRCTESGLLAHAGLARIFRRLQAETRHEGSPPAARARRDAQFECGRAASTPLVYQQDVAILAQRCELFGVYLGRANRVFARAAHQHDNRVWTRLARRSRGLRPRRFGADARPADWDSPGLRAHRIGLVVGRLTVCKRKAGWHQRTPRNAVDLRQSRRSRRSRIGPISRPSAAEAPEVPWPMGAKNAVHEFDACMRPDQAGCRGVTHPLRGVQRWDFRL